MKFDADEKAKQMAWFNTEACVAHEGKEYRLTESEIGAIHSRGNYWHLEGDPSSWLVTALVGRLKSKFRKVLPREKVIELAAEILKSSVGKVESALNWNANYMAFHDGGSPEEHHIYPNLFGRTC
jgi:hypothetical protein